MSGYGTSAPFTLSPDSQDFVVLCQLVPGKRAFYGVRVPRLAVPSPASFRPHLAVTPLPWTRSYPQVCLRFMKVNLLQGTYTPTLTPMPGVHNALPPHRRPRAVLIKPKGHGWAARGALGR